MKKHHKLLRKLYSLDNSITILQEMVKNQQLLDTSQHRETLTEYYLSITSTPHPLNTSSDEIVRIFTPYYGCTKLNI